MTAHKHTLLVVDDHENNRELLRRRLSKLDYGVEMAEDGKQAIEMLGKRPYDLVLLDIHMPEMNGFEVLEHMRQDTLWRRIPVIMITALDDMDSAARCIALGAEDYLLKPFNAKILQARIEAALEKLRLQRLEREHLQQLNAEKQRADDLLHALFPHMVVEELKATGTVRPRRYENVAVLFADIVGFTPYCDAHHAEEVIADLQQLFEAFEDIVERNEMEKIKTIGDAFMATAGLLRRIRHPVLNCIHAGVEMIEAAQQTPAAWQVRVGIHIGPVMAGLAGRRQYVYDLWGDTVNTAARIESHGEPGAVNLSSYAWQRVADQCRGESHGLIDVKGKGKLELYRFKEFLPPGY